MKDLQSKIGVVISIIAAAITATANGAGIDLQGFNSCAFLFSAGAITDGTHTPKLQESDDNSAWTDVAAADQVGTLAAITSNSQQKVGYKGNKRYVRAVVTVAGATTGGIYSAIALRGDADISPVA
jgi:major membrane immunogen (membrane-anchored lipoprotein)